MNREPKKSPCAPKVRNPGGITNCQSRFRDMIPLIFTRKIIPKTLNQTPTNEIFQRKETERNSNEQTNNEQKQQTDLMTHKKTMTGQDDLTNPSILSRAFLSIISHYPPLQSLLPSRAITLVARRLQLALPKTPQSLRSR